MFSNNLLMAAAGGAGLDGYVVEGSAIIDVSDSATLGFTPAVAADRTVQIRGCWLKVIPGVANRIGCAFRQTPSNQFDSIDIGSTGFLIFRSQVDSSNKLFLKTSAQYRDPAAYMQVICVYDSTPATPDGDDCFIYVNGVKVTDYATETYPSQNDALEWGNNVAGEDGRNMWYGSNGDGSYGSNNITQAFYQDGIAFSDITDYGEFDSNGEWRPIDISGLTFGTNGFLLEGGVDVAAGTDSSGNSNDFTPSGTITATNDSPTNDADNDYGNYCTWNNIDEVGANLTISNGNLTVVDSSAGTWDGARATHHIPSTGIWGVQLTQNGAPLGWELGLAQRSYDLDNGGGMWATADTICYCPYQGTGSIYSDAAAVQTSLGTTGDTDVVEMIVDMDAGNVKWYKNSVLLGTAEDLPATTTDDPWFFTINCGGVSIDLDFDFGQLGYDPNGTVAGALALSTANMPTPAIDPTEHHQVELVAHDGSSTNVTCNWDMDVYDTLIIAKDRDNSQRWYIADGLVGYSTHREWESGGDAPTSDSNVFSVSGTTLTLGSTLSNTNYVVEFWKAGAAGGASNSEGTDTVTVSANTVAGFSIVKDITAPAEGIAGHGLDSAPEFIITDKQAAAWNSVANWPQDLGDGYMYMDSNAIFVSSAGGLDADATLLDLGNVVFGAVEYIAYCWHGVDGYSAFGSIIGNADTDGPVNNVGISPITMFTKRSSAGTASWNLIHSAREDGNVANQVLYFDVYNAEGTTIVCDLLSNGYKLRSNTDDVNGSGSTLNYAVWGTPIQGPGDGSTSQGRAR